MSPPEGLAEPGHPRSTMYPLLYRDGEQAETRYLRDAPALLGLDSRLRCTTLQLGVHKHFVCGSGISGC